MPSVVAFLWEAGGGGRFLSPSALGPLPTAGCGTGEGFPVNRSRLGNALAQGWGPPSHSAQPAACLTLRAGPGSCPSRCSRSLAGGRLAVLWAEAPPDTRAFGNPATLPTCAIAGAVKPMGRRSQGQQTAWPITRAGDRAG